MAGLKILIVDDEVYSRKKIRTFLKDEPSLSIREAGDGPEAPALIREERPDIVFLDIQMSGMDGFALIEAVGREAMPAVVFITAFDQYVLAAFEVRNPKVDDRF